MWSQWDNCRFRPPVLVPSPSPVLHPCVICSNPVAPALRLREHTALMNIDKQYKKAPNQYLHETRSEPCVLPPRRSGDLRDIGPAAQTCDRVVTRFSDPERDAGTYLRAARVPMATTEVWCHCLAEHVFTSDCLETLPPLHVTHTLSFIAARTDVDVCSSVWQLKDYNRDYFTPPATGKKTWLFFTCFVKKSLFSKKLKVSAAMGDVHQWNVVEVVMSEKASSESNSLVKGISAKASLNWCRDPVTRNTKSGSRDLFLYAPRSPEFLPFFYLPPHPSTHHVSKRRGCSPLAPLRSQPTPN